MHSLPTLSLVPPSPRDDALRLKQKNKIRVDAFMRQSLDDTPMKKAYNLIRFLNATYMSAKNAKMTEARWILSEAVVVLIGELTPRMLMQMFPPTKKYDGARYECKDYFSTMAALEMHGIDTPIGASAIELLWDYDNSETRKFLVQYLSVASDMRKLQGGKGILEEWAEREDLPLYYEGKDVYGRKVIVNNQTGEASLVKKPKLRKPRWWRLIKGDARKEAPS